MAERILIVDDEETLCEALRFNLDAAGYETAVAHSAEEALATDLSGFSLILLDIMMGEISGVQLARIIRNNAATARIPIIFCTAKDGEEDMIEGLDLGADDYITKPYSLRNVLARIRSVLRRCPGGGGNTSDTYGRRRQRSPAHQKGIRDSFPAFAKPWPHILPRRNPYPHLARRGHRSGPRDRRQHNADTAKDRQIREKHSHALRIRIWLHRLKRLHTPAVFSYTCSDIQSCL